MKDLGDGVACHGLGLKEQRREIRRAQFLVCVLDVALFTGRIEKIIIGVLAIGTRASLRRHIVRRVGAIVVVARGVLS